MKCCFYQTYHTLSLLLQAYKFSFQGYFIIFWVIISSVIISKGLASISFISLFSFGVHRFIECQSQILRRGMNLSSSLSFLRYICKAGRKNAFYSIVISRTLNRIKYFRPISSPELLFAHFKILWCLFIFFFCSPFSRNTTSGMDLLSRRYRVIKRTLLAGKTRALFFLGI